MTHPCKSGFWGDTAEVMLLWLDYLELALPDPGYPNGKVRYLTLPTWLSVCVLRGAIEDATGTPLPPSPPWLGGAVLDPEVEAEFRQITQVLTAALVADQYDEARQDKHDPLEGGWMFTPQGVGNPELGAKDKLVGVNAAPPGPPDWDSLLGRIRGSLGS